MPDQMTPEERQEFINHVVELSKKLNLSEAQRRRTEELAEKAQEAAENAKTASQSAHTTTRVLKWVIVGMGFFLFIGAFYVNEQREDGQDLKATVSELNNIQKVLEEQAITSCVNANEVRLGQTALWDFIIDVSVASNPDAPPVVKQFYSDLRNYTHALFAQRDCSNLDEEVTLPEPPRIPTPEEIEGEA